MYYKLFPRITLFLKIKRYSVSPPPSHSSPNCKTLRRGLNQILSNLSFMHFRMIITKIAFSVKYLKALHDGCNIDNIVIIQNYVSIVQIIIFTVYLYSLALLRLCKRVFSTSEFKFGTSCFVDLTIIILAKRHSFFMRFNLLFWS